MSFANPQATRTRIPTTFTPSNYTPVAVQNEGTNKVSAHLKGIDNALVGGGGSGEEVVLTSQTIDGGVATGDPVYWDGASWKTATSLTDRPSGVKNGTAGEVVLGGKCDGLSGIVAGTDYWLDASGGLSTTETDTYIGVGFSTTELLVDVDESPTVAAASPAGYSKQTATASQTLFTTPEYVPGSNTLNVYVNGMRQVVSDDYTETSSTSVTFTSGLLAGDVVVFLVLGSHGLVVLREEFVATASQTVFDLTQFTYVPGSDDLLVFSGSILMKKGASNDYVETDSDTITFNTGRSVGTNVTLIRVVGSATLSETVRYTAQTIDGGVSTGDPVVFDGTKWVTADSSTDRPTAVKNATSGEVVITGKCTGLSGLTAGVLYYMDTSGGLTTTDTGTFIGVALTTTTLSVSMDNEGAAVGTPTLYEKQTATAGQTVFTIPTYSTGTNSLWVFRNGQRQTVGVSYTETNNTTITFSSGLTVGDEVLFIQLGTGSSNLLRNDFTATAGQTVFDLTFNYSPGADELLVFSGGAIMRVTDDYTETDGNTITFVSGRSLNEKVTVFKVGGGSTFSLRAVEANTAGSGSPNVLTESESGKVLTNEGASAENYHSLPSASAGMEYTFYCQDANGIRAVAASGDTIRVGSTVSAAAGYIRSTTVGSWVTLTCINATEWIGHDVTGTWSIV